MELNNAEMNLVWHMAQNVEIKGVDAKLVAAFQDKVETEIKSRIEAGEWENTLKDIKEA